MDDSKRAWSKFVTIHDGPQDLIGSRLTLRAYLLASRGVVVAIGTCLAVRNSKRVCPQQVWFENGI
jgi:hypothetical protein